MLVGVVGGDAGVVEAELGPVGHAELFHGTAGRCVDGDGDGDELREMQQEPIFISPLRPLGGGLVWGGGPFRGGGKDDPFTNS